MENRALILQGILEVFGESLGNTITKEEAILIALDWFSERQPTIFCEEVIEDAEVL